MLEPDLNSPVHGAGEKDLVVVQVPGHFSNRRGVCLVDEKGVGGAGGGALKHYAGVHPHHHHCCIVVSEVHRGGHSCKSMAEIDD